MGTIPKRAPHFLAGLVSQPQTPAGCDTEALHRFVGVFFPSLSKVNRQNTLEWELVCCLVMILQKPGGIEAPEVSGCC